MQITKRTFVFLEFLIGGVILGIIGDIVVINLLTDKPITWQTLLIIVAITTPFALISEYVVDKIDFIKIFKIDRKYRKTEVFLEFLIFGIVFGVIEDLIVFHFATGEQITYQVLIVATLVAIPFAFIGEYVIDRIDMLVSYKQGKIVWKNHE